MDMKTDWLALTSHICLVIVVVLGTLVITRVWAILGLPFNAYSALFVVLASVLIGINTYEKGKRKMATWFYPLSVKSVLSMAMFFALCTLLDMLIHGSPEYRSWGGTVLEVVSVCGWMYLGDWVLKKPVGHSIKKPVVE